MATVKLPVLTVQQIDEALGRIHDGLRKYCWIQTNFKECDVSEDRLFQTRFNGFYKVRKPDQWRGRYYELMQKAKRDGISFATALRELKKQTGNIEASFASKLVATLDPTKPVIDTFVLHNLGLRLPYYNAPNRESRVIELYERLSQRYDALLASPTGQQICEKFGDRYRWARITEQKKVDLVLWQLRDK